MPDVGFVVPGVGTQCRSASEGSLRFPYSRCAAEGAVRRSAPSDQTSATATVPARLEHVMRATRIVCVSGEIPRMSGSAAGLPSLFASSADRLSCRCIVGSTARRSARIARFTYVGLGPAGTSCRGSSTTRLVGRGRSPRLWTSFIRRRFSNATGTAAISVAKSAGGTRRFLIPQPRQSTI
ncbi:hypothetical protein BOX05_gp01 [Gordonia phage GAL1]|uniref:Uncharacterized protein n=1 Tax=Gordonia phage GAL1 TaxID=1647469 RepID=A0A159B6A5_9CAUD|nr:hypothetical protein BOX05_gp01 [Gordonia phage GAL1]AKJ72017.1 hypothetical protein GAL1_1 [Gordonia phage GAL1]